MSKITITRALGVVAACAVAVAGCHAADDSGEKDAQVALVEAQAAQVRPMQESVTAYGSAEVSADGAEAVTVDVEALVAQVLVASGEPVHRSQPLLRLKPSAASKLEADKATRDASTAVADADRLGRLHELGLATNAELATARAAAKSAVQLRDSLSARIGDGVTLSAPRDGVVDGLQAQPGDVIAAGTLVATIIDPAAGLVRLGVEPEDAARIRPQQRVMLALLSAATGGAEGRVTHVDPRVDPQTRLATALVQLDPATPLAPGTTLRGQILIERHEKAIVVPRSAVLFENDQAHVFVVHESKAQRREVKTGISDADVVEIVSGIRAGEQVVVTGNYELEDGMAVNVSQPKS